MALGIGFHSILAFIVSLILLTLALWIVGRGTVGGDKAKFSDAFWIALIGLIVGSLVSQWIHYIGFIISLLIWLSLIKHFFDTGWLGALGIAIVTIIVWIIIILVLNFLFGFTMLGLPRIPRLLIFPC